MRLIFTSFLFLISFLACSQEIKESIESIATLPDSTQVDSMVRLSRLSAIADNPNLGVEQAKWAYNKALKEGFNKKLVMSRFYIARNFHQENNIDSALHHYSIALKEINENGNEHWRKFVVNNMCNLYRQKGEFKQAIQLVMGIIEEHGQQLDSVQISKFYSDLGYTYDRMKEFKTAIKYQRIALKFVGSKNDYFKNFIFCRIAIANDDLSRFDSAHYYNQKALKYYVENGDSIDVGPICSNIGNTYLKQKDWSKALTYLERAKRLNLAHGDDGNKAITFINLGTVYTELGRYKDAKNALNKGVDYSNSWNNSKFLSEAFFFKSKLFEKSNQLDSALYYFKEYKLVEDSLYNIEKINEIEEISAKYETEKKEQQIELQNAEISEKESAIKANQSVIFALIILTILIFVSAFALYKRYQGKKNLEVQQIKIEEQEKGLLAVFKAQEEERKRISKDLHDGIGQQLSGLKMAIQTISSRLLSKLPEEEEEFRKLAQIASDSADEVRTISHQMMPRALTELGLIEAISDMLDKSLSLTKIEYEFEHYGIENRLEENVEISLYRVTQELINNIIKHSSAKRVSVQLFKNKDKVILVVEDDGVGMNKSKTDGHGLLNMKNRINTLHGEMNLEPSPNSGTLATVRIPILRST